MATEKGFKILKWLEVRTTLGNKYVPVNRIIYIKAENKSSTIYFSDMSFVKTNHLLKWFEKKLKEPVFIRCHNSYIVNCLHIELYCGKGIITKGRLRIPISRQKKLLFKKNLNYLHQS